MEFLCFKKNTFDINLLSFLGSRRSSSPDSGYSSNSHCLNSSRNSYHCYSWNGWASSYWSGSFYKWQNFKSWGGSGSGLNDDDYWYSEEVWSSRSWGSRSSDWSWGYDNWYGGDLICDWDLNTSITSTPSGSDLNDDGYWYFERGSSSRSSGSRSSGWSYGYDNRNDGDLIWESDQYTLITPTPGQSRPSASIGCPEGSPILQTAS